MDAKLTAFRIYNFVCLGDDKCGGLEEITQVQDPATQQQQPVYDWRISSVERKEEVKLILLFCGTHGCMQFIWYVCTWKQSRRRREADEERGID